MATRRRSAFDPKSFLAQVGEGRTISKYRKDQAVFQQGDPADAVFYIQKGKLKVTVPGKGKRRSSQSLDRRSSAVRAAWPDNRGGSRPSGR
jgi:CRP-like cAMP-binding protein